MNDSVYLSKVDQWLLVTFCLGALVALGVCVPQFIAGTVTVRLFLVFALLVAIGLPAWILLTTAYTLTTGFLVVRSGPFSWSIPLRQITSVKPTRSPLSSPALSLDRLRIEYSGARALMISPENRTGFLADLRSRGVAVG